VKIESAARNCIFTNFERKRPSLVRENKSGLCDRNLAALELNISANVLESYFRNSLCFGNLWGLRVLCTPAIVYCELRAEPSVLDNRRVLVAADDTSLAKLLLPVMHDFLEPPLASWIVAIVFVLISDVNTCSDGTILPTSFAFMKHQIHTTNLPKSPFENLLLIHLIPINT
jgi:hypothetical protein